MNISFALTENELMAGIKTVTRRRWKESTAKKFKKGSLHTGWNKVTFAKGARRLVLIRATEDAYQERLGDMPESDLKAEGGMCDTVEDFIKLIGGTPDELVWVARFEVIEYIAFKAAA